VITLISVQTGTFTLEPDAPMTIHRGAEDGAPKIMPAGTEFTIEAGDVVVTGRVTPSIPNDGKEAASYQSAMIYPPDPVVIDPCAPLGHRIIRAGRRSDGQRVSHQDPVPLPDLRRFLLAIAVAVTGRR